MKEDQLDCDENVCTLEVVEKMELEVYNTQK